MSKELAPGYQQYVKPALVTAGVLAAGVVAYNKLRPQRNKDPGENYFDIIDDLDQRVVAAIGSEVGYVMLGGGISAALMDPETVYDFDAKETIAPKGIRKDQFRKKNGTQSDMDILVFSTDESVIEALRLGLTPDQEVIDGDDQELRQKELEKPGAKLKIGVTGLMPEAEYDRPASFLDRALKPFKKDWVSQRLLGDDASRYFAISDIKVELPDDYFDRWRLKLNSGNSIPTLQPLLQVLCYPARASHGIRLRDKEKVTSMVDNVGGLFGAKLEWGEKEQTVNLVVDEEPSPGVAAAIEFCKRKNDLRWSSTKERLGKKEAAILAARIAIHRQLDTREIFVQFGQGGWLYDNVISRFSRESQGALH